MIEVVERTPADVQWGFESAPCVRTSGWGSVTVDPFPCYPHDIKLVESLAEKVNAAFPITFPTTIYLLPNEVTGRTNGYMERRDDYDSGYDESLQRYNKWSASIVLSAKRIPIHPAMTRYLVSHEYGHVVEDWVAYCQKRTDTDLKKEYEEIRGHKSPSFYGGATWHASIGELFANDFRILVTGIETEFWPHPRIPRPEDVPNLKEWWGEAVSKYTSTSEVDANANLRIRV